MKQMKKIALLLIMVIVSATGVLAQSIGTPFEYDGCVYRVSKKDLDHPENNEAVVLTVKGKGKVVIPSSVKTPEGMDKETYKVVGCARWVSTVEDGVTELEFSEGFQEITAHSLRKPQTLEKVIIPASCTNVGIGCFLDCPKLKAFEVKTGNSKYKALNNALLSFDGTKLVYVPGAMSGEYQVPSGVTEILPTAMTNCRELTNIKIPSSVSKISEMDDYPSVSGSGTRFTVDAGNSKFCDKDGLLCSKDGKKLVHVPYKYDKLTDPEQELEIPASVTTVEKGAAISCFMKMINFNNVESIGTGAFNSCSALETVKIGKKVNQIGSGAFTNCPRISAFDVDAQNTKYQSIAGVIFTKPTADHLVLYPSGKTGAYTVPEGTKIIDQNAFTDVALLEEITIAKSVTTIQKFAFKSTKKLEKVNFNNTTQLTSIEEQAFSNTKLKKVTIPSCVTTLGVAAFSENSALEEVNFAAGSKLTEMPSNLFEYSPKLAKVVFEGDNNIQTIGSSVFNGCESLKSFAVPKNVTTISSGAFRGTAAMETVTFDENAVLTNIGTSAFAESGIQHINLPKSVKLIQKLAFDHCSKLNQIKLSKNLEKVEEGAFNFCDNLKKFIVESGNAKYSTLDGMLCDIKKETLEVFPAGKADSKYTLVPYFKKIAPYAFYGSRKLSNITFPRTITEIGIRAIALCDNLRSMSFMGEQDVPVLTTQIMYESGNPKNITIYVRKKWYNADANEATIRKYNNDFKEVHPSFVTTVGYDRGTEFFPTSIDNVGAISFYDERTSVILGETTKEEAMTATDKFGKKFPEKVYVVSSILDFAYENTQKVRAIVALGELGYVGMKAFTGSSITDLYFVGNVPGELGSELFEQKESYSFKDNQNIYVKQSKVNAYKQKWQVDAHSLKITHEIPQKTDTHGGSVCFPFDVKYPSTGGADDVKPYVPVDYKHAYDVSEPYVRAFSIDDYYVPAFTGALIRSKQKVTVITYCQMDEDQKHKEDKLTAVGYDKNNNNRMVGAVEDITIADENDYHHYAFSKKWGKFVILKAGVTFPYFKAYLRMAKNPSTPAKGFTILFDDDNTSTAIDGITGTDKDNENAPYYNLSGMQVDKPVKGIYIRNGKKIIIK